MAGGTKRKSDYKSYDFVASDDDERPTKKGKDGPSTFRPSTSAQTDDNGDKYWEISKARRVVISEFNKKTMVNIREYYEKDGKSLPGRKGISMTVDQYSTLIELMPQIEEMLKERGEKVPRPAYVGSTNPRQDADDEDDDMGDSKKANIDATSDEDEE